MGKTKIRQLYGTDVHPLTEQEVDERLARLMDIIDTEANEEINLMCAHKSDSMDDLRREMATDPKDQIDEWVEKVREYTEKQTLIHCARLKRIAKLQVLEAFCDIRDLIKEEARETIKEKINARTSESDDLLGRMLYQGVIRLMEPTVLVHTTKADIKRVEKHYNWAVKKFQDETHSKLKLVTSKHPLKDTYYGRIVLSDKKSLVFVDVNLHKAVDMIAEEVFTQIVGLHGKYKNPLVVGVKNLKKVGYRFLPKGPNITNARLDVILAQIHGDPRTQMPDFHLVDESKRAMLDHKDSATSTGGHLKAARRKVTIPYVTPPVTGTGSQPEQATSVAPPRYAYRYQEDAFDEDVKPQPTRDLYNLDNAPSSLEVVSNVIEAEPTVAPPSKFRRRSTLQDKIVALEPPSDKVSLQSGAFKPVLMKNTEPTPVTKDADHHSSGESTSMGRSSSTADGASVRTSGESDSNPRGSGTTGSTMESEEGTIPTKMDEQKNIEKK